MEIEMLQENPNTKQFSYILDETIPFIEKYRPKTLPDMISHEDILSTINLFVEKKNIPHFLFHGPPGTGKTSCILALALLIISSFKFKLRYQIFLKYLYMII